MKKTLKTESIYILLLLLPFIYLAINWQDFPDRVPIHFNHKGEPDGFADKLFGLLILPVINIFSYLLLKFLPSIDPKKKSFALSEGSYNAIRLTVLLFMTFIFFITASAALTGTFLSPKLIFIGIALFFLVLGNYLTNMRPNYFVGIRTPWTLENEEVWKKTHRFAGRLWVFSSCIFILITIIVPKLHPIILILFILSITILPVVYSYRIFQKLSNPPDQYQKRPSFKNQP